MRREVGADPENPAVWISARLTYLSEEQSQVDAAQALVLESLPEGAGLDGPNSGQLRDELRKQWNEERSTKVSSVAVSTAIKKLTGEGRIDWEPGARANERKWYLTSLPTDAGQAGQTNLPNLPEPARQAEDAMPEPAPMYREAGSAGINEDLGRLAIEEELYGHS